MPLMTVGNCYRGRKDCKSFSVIESPPADVTQEQFDTLDFVPTSFVCCGCISREVREPKQDAYRLCFKNADGDDMTDNDEQDLLHVVKVCMDALAVIATRRVARGYIDVPADFESEQMISVNTHQGLMDGPPDGLNYSLEKDQRPKVSDHQS